MPKIIVWIGIVGKNYFQRASPKKTYKVLKNLIGFGSI
jgi:hypothetical protein